MYNKRVSQDICNSSRKFKDESDWIVRNDVYPPLVSEEVFNLVRERLKKREVSGQAHPKEVYLLSGKIRSGVCGTAYCGERKRNGKGIISYSYFCNSRNKGHGSSCGNPLINRLLSDYFSLLRVLDTALQPERLKIKRNNIINAVADGMIEDDFRDILAGIKADENSCLERQKSLTMRDTDINISEEKLYKAISELSEYVYERDIPECKKFIARYVKSVTVYDTKVEVTVTIPSELLCGCEYCITKSLGRTFLPSPKEKRLL